MRGLTRRRAALAAILLTLAGAGSAWAAFQSLPSNGTQVNSDLAAGINPADPVKLEDPTNADVVGGALTAGAPAVPWAIFRQTETTAAKHDQIFVRAFKQGAWATEGTGTVGGVSSASPLFSGSLNFDQGEDGEAPTIDFAGAGRTVPWATWYESTAAFAGQDEIFASRFDNAGGKWIFAGQSRGVGTGTTPVPSLNIHTDQEAVNPAVAGGSAVDPTKPGPWVTWQEKGAAAPGTGKDQIFVVKPIGPAAANCNGVKPIALDPTAAPIGGFCWQQVGVERIGSADPSLNVDRTRDGVEPDVAFTGANDAVPWVVWYEQNNSGDGLHNNEMVFAAKGVAPSATTPPTGTVDGGFNWIAVGRTGQGVLDNSAHGGSCGASQDNEAACSVNAAAGADAEDPRVAAGTMTPGAPTVPWVVWDEGAVASPNANSVFVARLVSGQFVIANGGQPIATGDRADITFSGNTPYVTWHHNGTALSGHFATPDQFVADNGAVGTSVSDEVRAPISSSCIATPFNQDGAACQGGTIGTPFFLFSDGDDAHAKLFADAYQTDAPITGSATGVTTGSATVAATVNPQGGPVRVHFDFGTTTAYGQATPAQTIGPTNSATPFSAGLQGLAAGTTIHFRAVAVTDFGTVVGADATFKTATSPNPPDHTRPKVRLTLRSTTSLKALLRSGKFKFKLQVSEASRATVTGTIKTTVKHRHHSVSLFKRASASFAAAGTKTITLKLSKAGRRALRRLHKPTTLTITAKVTDTAHNTTTQHATTKLR